MSLGESLHKTASVCTTFREEDVALMSKNDILTSADEAWSNYRESNSIIESWYTIQNQAIEYLRNSATTIERQRWETVLSSKDSKQIWNKIDWKGKLLPKTNSLEKPELNDLCSHFMSK